MNDILGHPIEVGRTVLTNGYYGTTLTEITKVEKVTDKWVYVNVDAQWWCRKTNTSKSGPKKLRKKPYQVLVIDAQYKHNKEHYPENML